MSEIQATSELRRLLAAKVLTPVQAEFIGKQQSHLARYFKDSRGAGKLAVEMGFATDAQVSQALATDTEVSHLQPVEIAPAVLRRLQVKPLGVSDGVLSVAALAPLSESEKRELVAGIWRTDLEVHTVKEEPVDPAEVLVFLQELAADAQVLLNALDRFNQNPEDGSVSDVLKGILNEAAQEQVSDVHFLRDLDPLNCFISYRIDGRLTPRHLLTPAAARVLATRIKNDAGMDYAKVREPQDGRLTWTISRRKIDVRVASQPAGNQGEKLVLRLLDTANRRPLAQQLQDHPILLSRVMPYTRLPPKTSGLILVTGPTNSGKTSFLSGLYQEMPRLTLAISTAEDPVEQRLLAIAQTTVQPEAGLDFPQVLRAQMRGDPDVLGVGEIRDRATAEAALRSAESGHFVTSTLHAGNCDESISRLLNLLDPQYRSVGEIGLSQYLQMVLNLRLVPRVCSCARTCKLGEAIPLESVQAKLGLPADMEVLVPVGCPRCRETGHAGRVLVPEAIFIPSDQAVRKQVLLSMSGKSQVSLSEVTGVEHYARETSVRRLMAAGQLDVLTAAAVLGEYL